MIRPGLLPMLVLAALPTALGAQSASAVDSLVASGRLQEAAWAARAAGDTARGEAILARLDSILRAPPQRARPLGQEDQGVSYTFRFDHGGGVESIFKVDGSDIFCPECGAAREVASYRLDRLLGFDLSPMTVEQRIVYDGDTLTGSTAYFVRGTRTPAEAGRTKPDALRLFDAVLGNSDRHRENWLVLADGRIVAIDHNRAFEYQATTTPTTCWEAEVDSIAAPATLGAPFARYRQLPADSFVAALHGTVDAELVRRFVAMRARVVARVEQRAERDGQQLPRTDCARER